MFYSRALQPLKLQPRSSIMKNQSSFPFLENRKGTHSSIIYKGDCGWFTYILVFSSMIFRFPNKVQFSSAQLLSSVRLFATPWIAARQASLSITNSRSLLKPMSIKSVMPSSHVILCHPLLPLPPIPPSISVFSNETTLCMRWPKYWSLSFNISPSNEHPRLIAFRMDWLDLLAVQGTLKSLLQHHSSKASIFVTQLPSQSNCHIHIWPLETP